MLRKTFTILFSFISFLTIAQDRYVLQLTDKNNSPFSISNPSAYLSARAIQRRINQGIPVDITDLPVNPAYQNGIAATGATILGHSKWHNVVLIQTSSAVVLNAISLLPYVSNVTGVGRPANGNGIPYNKFNNELLRTDEMFSTVVNRNSNASKTSSFNYGPSFNQVAMLGGDIMHNDGYIGTGLHIAVIDAGFENANNMDAFDSLFANNQVLGTYDFVDNEINVYDNSSHGSYVLSIIGSNLPGVIMGTAPGAKFWLLRSEDAPTEYIIEEYNWAEAAEFADSVGADIINSSLGYTVFDDPGQNHTYNDLDGNTTPVTRAADFAAKKGIVAVNSAGNEGNGFWNYISAPADADSIIATGAVDSLGFYVGFSGNGPTPDGRVKPNVAAQGFGTYVADVNNFGSFPGNGTSFSGPLITGMVACLWQCHPNATNMQIINAIQQSASQFASPDTELGYGIPNFPQACIFLGGISINQINHGDNLFLMGSNPFSHSLQFAFYSDSNQTIDILICDMLGKIVYQISSNVKPVSVQKFSVPLTMSNGVYVIKVISEDATFEKKIVKN